MIEISRIHDKPFQLDVQELRGCQLKSISFHRSVINCLDLSFSVLVDIDFRSAEMSGCIFVNSTIKNSKLIMVNATKTDFTNCSFDESILLYSDFSNAKLKNTKLVKCKVGNINFMNCDLRGAILLCEGLETCVFKGAIYDSTTIWYDKFEVGKCGAVKTG